MIILRQHTARYIITGLICLALSACAQPAVVSTIDPGGNLIVLSPDDTFARSLEEGKWVLQGSPAPASLTITQYNTVPALKIDTAKGGFSMVRHVQANLMTTPYLDWAWIMENHTGPYHGVSFMVGFRAPDGSAHAGPASLAPSVRGSPVANRIISLRWSKSALKRGYMEPYPGSTENAIIYSVRGGSENTGLWWRETIDLSDLYARSWPGEDLTKTSISFIAVVVTNPKISSLAYLSYLRLFR